MASNPTDVFDLTGGLEGPKPSSAPTLDITKASEAPVNIDPEEISRRAWKYNIALGEDSPGEGKIAGMISKGDGETTLREIGQYSEYKKRQEAAKAVFMEQASNPDFDGQAVLTAMQKRVGTDSVLERLYSERMMAASLSMTKNAEEVSAGYDENASAFEKFAIEEMTKREGFSKLIAQADARVKGMGWLDMDYVSSAAKSYLIPGYSWYKQATNNTGQKTDGFTAGGAKAAQYAYINSLPPDEAIAEATKTYNELAAANPLEARDWVNGLIWYADADLDTALGFMDLAGATPVGLISKTGRKVASGVAKELAGAARIREVTKGATKLPADSFRRQFADARVLEDIQRPTSAANVAVRNRVARTAKVMADDTMTPAEKLAGAGHVDEAAELHAKSLIQEVPADAPLKAQFEKLVERTPSLSNPKQFDIEAGLYGRAKGARLAERLQENIKRLTQSYSLARVSRLPAEVEAEAMQIAQREVRQQYKDVPHAIIAVRETPSVLNKLSNTASIEVTFGKTDGGLFKSKQAALNVGRNRYNMLLDESNIVQEGDGYVIKVRKDIDETADDIRDQLITLDNTSRTKRSFGFLPKSINSAKDSVSKFQAEQRAVLTHATVANQHLVREAGEIITQLSFREKRALRKIMEKNRDFEAVPGKAETRGKFYETQNELENEYLLHVGRLPTEKESEAYWTFVQLSDQDYIYRSLSIFSVKARAGVEKIGFQLADKEVGFEGKLVSSVPWKSELPGRVFYAEDLKTGSNKVFTLNDVAMQSKIDKGIKEGRLKVVQVFNPEDASIGKSLGITGHVNFIVVPNVKRGALNLTEQLPYRPGFHIKYKDQYFVKQPRVYWDSAKRQVYGGDTAIFGMTTEAQAQKYSRAMEDARVAYNNKDDAALLKASKNLPFDAAELKQKFKSKVFNPDIPFVHTRAGVSASDLSVRTASGGTLQDVLGKFDDFSNSPWNMNKEINQKYTGEKDSPLWSVHEEGTEENPLISLSNANTVDPMTTQVQAMGEMIRSRHYNDYQLSAAESFVEEFGVRRGLLQVGGKPVTKFALRRNPVYYLNRADVIGFGKDADTARVIQRATRNLVSQPSYIAQSLAAFQGRLLSGIYNRWGEKYIAPADTVLTAARTSLVSLPVKARAIAFHTKLGLFNPTQIFLQGQTVFNMAAIAPKHGASGAMVSAWMRRADILPEDMDVIDHFAKGASKITPGWTPEMFKESYKHLKETGFDVIGGDLSWRNDLADPQIFQGKFGRFLEFGATLFNGTERFVRLSAWNTAYAEYVSKYPKLVGKLTSNDAKTILSRAQDLSGNMTRDAHAFWQEGYASMVTQFWGYSGRMFDLMTGNRLTLAEKSRLFGTWSMLYGVPIAATPLAPIWPWQDQLKEQLIAAGYDPNSGVLDPIINGFVSTITEAMTGEQYNVGRRYGPGSIDALYQLTNTKFGETGLSELTDLLGGASGTIFADIIGDTAPIFGDFLDATSGNPNLNVAAEHFRDLVDNISSLNQADKAYLIYMYGVKKNKQGGVISTDNEPWEGVFHAVTGLSKMEDDQSYLLKNVMKDKEKLESGVRREAQKYYRLYLEEYKRGDYEAAQEFLDKGNAVAAAGLTPAQVKRAFSAVLKEEPYKDMVLRQWDKFQKKEGMSQ